MDGKEANVNIIVMLWSIFRYADTWHFGRKDFKFSMFCSVYSVCSFSSESWDICFSTMLLCWCVWLHGVLDNFGVLTSTHTLEDIFKPMLTGGILLYCRPSVSSKYPAVWLLCLACMVNAKASGHKTTVLSTLLLSFAVQEDASVSRHTCLLMLILVQEQSQWSTAEIKYETQQNIDIHRDGNSTPSP